MKKIALALVLFGVWGTAEAGDFVLECPVDYYFKDEDWCVRKKDYDDPNVRSAPDRYYEILTKEPLVDEILWFDENVMQEALEDNRSNPEFVVQSLVHELRIHKQCLAKVCFETFKQCSSGSDSVNNSQNVWCEKTVQRIFEIEKTKVYATVLGNQSRKERSLLKQKFVALRNRSNLWVHQKMSATNRLFESVAGALEDSCYVYVKNPRTGW